MPPSSYLFKYEITLSSTVFWACNAMFYISFIYGELFGMKAIVLFFGTSMRQQKADKCQMSKSGVVAGDRFVSIAQHDR